MRADFPEQVEALRAMVARAARAVAFTGAGISTESGIPDFRSPDSPWRRHRPIPFETFLTSPEARREAWRRKFALDDLHVGARPNGGHRALAALVAAGRIAGVITQNIDGLHQASGIEPERIVELHGNGTYAACLACAARRELAWIRSRFEEDGDPPDCPACGGLLKSATVAFGQRMPADAMRRAAEETVACDLFLAIGSSLVVMPAAGFPAAAKRNGARLVIVNREPTRLDAAADLVIHGEIGEVLGRLAR